MGISFLHLSLCTLSSLQYNSCLRYLLALIRLLPVIQFGFLSERRFDADMFSIEDEKARFPHLDIWRLADIGNDLQEPAISTSSQGVVHNYCRDGVKYVIKLRPSAVKLERKISLMETA